MALPEPGTIDPETITRGTETTEGWIAPDFALVANNSTLGVDGWTEPQPDAPA